MCASSRADKHHKGVASASQAARGMGGGWLYEILSPHVDEAVVAGGTESRGQKSDTRDAYGLAEKLRTGALGKRIFKAPREFSVLRELSRIHLTLVRDVVRVQSRLTSLYRSRGIPVPGASVYSARDREGWERRLATRSSTSSSNKRTRRGGICSRNRGSTRSFPSSRPLRGSGRFAPPGSCPSW